MNRASLYSGCTKEDITTLLSSVSATQGSWRLLLHTQLWCRSHSLSLYIVDTLQLQSFLFVPHNPLFALGIF